MSGLVAALLLPQAPARAAGAPSGVATLDWGLGETMIAIGKQPMAMVAANDYRKLPGGLPLSGAVADLGVPQQVNFELLAELRPELILTSPFLQHLEPTLERIAPLLRLSVYDAHGPPLSHRRQLAIKLGERLGRVSASHDYIAAAEMQFDQYKERLAAKNVPPLILASFIDARHLRVYGGAGICQQVLDRLGLKNAWPGNVSYWGYATVGVEALAVLGDVHMVVFEPIPAETEATLRRSPLWRRLPFVEAGRFTVLPPILVFGGLPAALHIAELLSSEVSWSRR